MDNVGLQTDRFITHSHNERRLSVCDPVCLSVCLFVCLSAR